MIKKKSKSRYKYEVRRLRRREQFIRREKLVAAFASRNKSNFWKEVKKVRGGKHPSTTHVIDGSSDTSEISEIFKNKLASTLNKHNYHAFQPAFTLSANETAACQISPDVVLQAIDHLKSGKKDHSFLDSTHFCTAAPVIADSLSVFFTVILHHGYLPCQLIDCVLVPIHKQGKNPSVSDSYRPIALASTLSKILEWCLLIQYASHFTSSDLQFGFKPNMSTSLCTGVLKSIVARYNQRGSPVFACFLDASKAFDLVRHDILFDLLLSRGLPPLVVRLLHSWYAEQRLRVRWNGTLSDQFAVSNGVRQGGVLSPILFSIYLDSLIINLKKKGIGCYWDHHFVGILAYADDIVLLAPCQSALRSMLYSCEKFAISNGLCFNPTKTQLIKFSFLKSSPAEAPFVFCGVSLTLLPSVLHLGNKLSHNLQDDEDVMLKCRQMTKAANGLFATFGRIDPSVLTFLFESYCLSLYGACLWKLSCKSLRSLEIAFNKCLRKIWKLPHNTHTGILHCTAGVQSLLSVVCSRSNAFSMKASSSPNRLVNVIFRESLHISYTFVGHNIKYGNLFIKHYTEQDRLCARVIRGIRCCPHFSSLAWQEQLDYNIMLTTIASA